MEILAPAGSFPALEAAVNYGADAIYVGGQRFSARKSAQNFSDSELLSAVDYCHARGVKLYVCCNTLMKETELNEVMDFIRYCYKIGVDALIVQDLGLFSRVREELPEMPLHASTQMTVTDSKGVNTLEKMGAKRVVLARELSKKELLSISKNTKAELEVFVHGALCISYSGQCLMSSILGTRSGNRGGCAQPCRLPYTLLKDGKPVTERGALLCPKDLCLADYIKELSDMGIASLKIEGRMKSPEYVAMVTRVYKKASQGDISQKEIEDMLKFFSRGGSYSGYYHGCGYGEMMDTSGDNKIATNLPELEKMTKKTPVSLYFEARAGENLCLTMATETGETVTVYGDRCELAHTKATDKSRMEEQLVKLGETPFAAETVEIITSGDCAVSIKSINALRREAAEKLELSICENYRRSLPEEISTQDASYTNATQPELCVEVSTKAQLEAAIDAGISRIYLPETLKDYAHLVPEPVLLCPPVAGEGAEVDGKNFDKVCIQNIGQLEAFSGKELSASHRLNLTNARTAEFLSAKGVQRMVVSPELNMKGIAALRKHTDAHLEVIGYGRLPLMLMKNCVIKSAYGCHCEAGSFALLDRKNEVFPILPTRCGNVIYNAKPLYMADRMEELKALNIDGIRLLFTDENYEKSQKIIFEYREALAGKNVKAPDGDFTRGHFYRGMQ